MKIKITKGDAWYEDLVGHTFYVDSEVTNSDVGRIYYIDPEWMYYVDPEWMAEVEGRRFVSAEDCEIVSEEVAELSTVDVIMNPPVKVGDYVRINKCEECPESVGKYGTVIRTGTATDADFDVDIPSKVYGDYTWIDADCDEWSVFPKTESESDAVSHPSHYTAGEIEVIDIIAQTVAGYSDPFVAHCVGTATKYLNRAPYKHDDPTEDLKKAKAYLEFATKKLEEDE